ncbi:Carboxylesterase type B [Neofusicoccum parvum]|uniref:Carboxylesterase type B n=1 Tax=Neofusicoccum parvum TaxID=310453 RepID=A0ACB5SAJ2_9PEZI|nr:Carboxylesterase type B [Neofusicoccum parvum]
MLTTALALLSLLFSAHLAEASPPPPRRGKGAPRIRLQARQDDLPILDLPPYQQAKASSFDATRDNIPFAAPPSANATNLPVMHWIYGGACGLGGKAMYAGKGLASVSNDSVIHVASNHRVGACGWLAGTTMEQDGLRDARAALSWTQQSIGLLGDVGGESGGAGSLLHLLAALDFSRDRGGGLEQQTQQFLGDAGWAGRGVACLRQESPQALRAASAVLSHHHLYGHELHGTGLAPTLLLPDPRASSPRSSTGRTRGA